MGFNSDNPDKKLKCFPCSCPDCPGFHECDIYDMQHSEQRTCGICNVTTEYLPITKEFIKDYISKLGHPEVQKRTRKKLEKSLKNNTGGYWQRVK